MEDPDGFTQLVSDLAVAMAEVRSELSETVEQVEVREMPSDPEQRRLVSEALDHARGAVAYLDRVDLAPMRRAAEHYRSHIELSNRLADIAGG